MKTETIVVNGVRISPRVVANVSFKKTSAAVTITTVGAVSKPALVQIADEKLFFTYRKGTEPKDGVWARTPEKSFSRAVHAFWS